MRAIDVMTRTVATVSPDTRIDAVVRLMVERRISGVPVVDDGGQVVGIISEGDLLRRFERPAPGWRELFAGPARPFDAHAATAADLMTADIVAVDALTSLAEIAELLLSRRIRRVPVLRDGRLVGIVSRADLLQVLTADGARPGDADRGIRERLLAELQGQPWATIAAADIVVSDGVVHLWGAVGSPEAHAALRVAAENTQGVRGIEDHTTEKTHYLV